MLAYHGVGDNQSPDFFSPWWFVKDTQALHNHNPVFNALIKQQPKHHFRIHPFIPKGIFSPGQPGNQAVLGGLGWLLGLGWQRFPPQKTNRTSLTQHLRLNTCYSPRLDAKSIKSTGRKMQRGRFFVFFKEVISPQMVAPQKSSTYAHKIIISWRKSLGFVLSSFGGKIIDNLSYRRILFGDLEFHL